jgi:hypothetical protein
MQIPTFTPDFFPPQPALYHRLKAFHPLLFEAATVVNYRTASGARAAAGHATPAAAAGTGRRFALRAPYAMGVWVRDGSNQMVLWAAVMSTGWANEHRSDLDFDARPVYHVSSARYAPTEEHLAAIVEAADAVAEDVPGIAAALHGLLASPATLAIDKHVAPAPVTLATSPDQGSFCQIWYHRKLN